MFHQFTAVRNLFSLKSVQISFFNLNLYHLWKNVTLGEMWLELCCLCLGYVSVGGIYMGITTLYWIHVHWKLSPVISHIDQWQQYQSESDHVSACQYILFLLENLPHYLVQAIDRVWKAHQDALFNVIRRQNEAVLVGGDAMCYSSGHTAKYRFYSLMDRSWDRSLMFSWFRYKINVTKNVTLKRFKHNFIQQHIVSTLCLLLTYEELWNQIKSSYWMNLEGLIQCLRFCDPQVHKFL